jgi:3-oxoacyl-[acyl-carrier protein] reductase
LSGRKIRVNAINSGQVDTEGTTSAGFTLKDNNFRKRAIAQTPLGRAVQPDDIAPIAVFRASRDSRWDRLVSGGLR